MSAARDAFFGGATTGPRAAPASGGAARGAVGAGAGASRGATGVAAGADGDVLSLGMVGSDMARSRPLPGPRAKGYDGDDRYACRAFGKPVSAHDVTRASAKRIRVPTQSA